MPSQRIRCKVTHNSRGVKPLPNRSRIGIRADPTQGYLVADHMDTKESTATHE